MQNAHLHAISNFIWGVADDILRDLYVRGKYRDVILPMVVIRRFDAVLEPSKEAVMTKKRQLDMLGVKYQSIPLCQASGQAFYNTSPYTMRNLFDRPNRDNLRDNFIEYIDGYSENVQEIINCFDFRNQIPKLASSNNLWPLLVKFLDPSINLSPYPSDTQPGLDNHAMGTIFEDLVRRFNEANNEEAGQHWTPRDVVHLMAEIIFQPVKDQLEGTYLTYDGACGTGGMLTIADNVLHSIAEERGKLVSTHLYGQEINSETYAIAKADVLLKGQGENADNIKGGPAFSTLSNDIFREMKFDFMLSNPPYGKSWKTDYERMGGKNINDSRFIGVLDGEEVLMLPRSSDGQLLFLLNLISKMKMTTEMGSRIAEVHNGSSLFTGDAGSGESNIRRYIIENDWLEAIIALPTNIFYNTGIATYIWVLANRKSEQRRGKVQLIDATQFYVPLRKNMGQKNCELTANEISKITDIYLNMEQNESSKIFKNHEFGYYKFNVERPLRLSASFSDERLSSILISGKEEDVMKYLFKYFGYEIFHNFDARRSEIKKLVTSWGISDEDQNLGRKALSSAQIKRLLSKDTWSDNYQVYCIAKKLQPAFEFGATQYDDLQIVEQMLEKYLLEYNETLTKTQRKKLYHSITWKNHEATPVIKKKYNIKKVKPNRFIGLFSLILDGKECVVEYETDTDLRESEQVALSMYSNVGGGVETPTSI